MVYVGGGSTANLLVARRLRGLDAVLAEGASTGVMLVGISAGMNCWFALVFRDGELVEAVSSRPDAAAYRIGPSGTGATETRIPTRYLGADCALRPSIAGTHRAAAGSASQP